MPGNWVRGRLKNVVTSVRNGVWGDDPKGDGSDVSCVRAADFDRPRLRVKSNTLPIRSVDQRALRQHRLQPGDLILEKSGGGEQQPVGQVVLFDLDTVAVCSNFCARMVPASNMDARFVSYIFSAAYTLGLTQAAIKQTTGIQNLDTGAFLASRWEWPELDQQRRIADFLDVETTRIDEAVRIRARQIALLGELLRNELSATAGELAATHGWVRVRHVLRRIEQGWSPQCEDRTTEPGEWGVIKSGCVNGGVFREDQHKALPAGIEPRLEYRLRKGDLLMSRASGSVDLIGSVAVVPETHTKLLLCDKIYRLTVDHTLVRPSFVAHMLRTHSVREHLKLGISGAEGMANNLPVAVVKDSLLPKAPLSMQDKVVNRLEERQHAIARLREAGNAQLSLFAERKQALIAAAVTGQFDVTTGRGVDLS